MSRLALCPMTIREANAFVASFHRHNRPTSGGKYAIGVLDGPELVGVAIVGRPTGDGAGRAGSGSGSRSTARENSDGR